MKHYYLWRWKMATLAVMAFLLISNVAVAQSPESVPSISKIMKSTAWYTKQAKIWKELTAQSPTNVKAWRNYYFGTRYAGGTKEQLSQIVYKMGKAVPDSYEYLYIKNFDQGAAKYDLNLMKQAYEQCRDCPELYYQFITYYELADNPKECKEYAIKLYKSRDIDPGLYEYNRNMLVSAGPNAILFTGGDDDTYPAWILQMAKGLRKDVLVLNLALCRYGLTAPTKGKPYLEKKLARRNLAIKARSLPDPKSKRFLPALCKAIQAKSPKTPIYVAMTVAEIDSFMNDLYLVGLAFQYSRQRINNMEILRNNFEGLFLFDHLTGQWLKHTRFASESVSGKININYSAGLMMLIEHYHNQGQQEKVREWTRHAVNAVWRPLGRDGQFVDYLEAKGIAVR